VQEQGGEIRRGDPDVDGLAVGINLGEEVCLQVVEYLRGSRSAKAGRYRKQGFVGTYPIVSFDLFVYPAIERSEARSIQQVSKTDERHGDVHVHQEHTRQEVYPTDLSHEIVFMSTSRGSSGPTINRVETHITHPLVHPTDIPSGQQFSQLVNHRSLFSIQLGRR
jgi:hypothetical protein